MQSTPTDFDTTVRLHIYDRVVDSGRPPSVEETAIALAASPSDVRAAYESLASGRVIVLEPGTHDIRMANPFSAVPTPFRVVTPTRSYFGNCIWDALGIPAALDCDARIEAECGDCGEPMSVEVVGGQLVSAEGMAHFGVPAARWWENIIYT